MSPKITSQPLKKVNGHVKSCASFVWVREEKPHKAMGFKAYKCK
jgi:hypothetical protein